jgi:hypothetical protein
VIACNAEHGPKNEKKNSVYFSLLLMACSSSLDDSSHSARHVFVLASSSNLRGHKRTYPTILESADHALFKMVRYVLLRPLRPELDAKTKTCLAEGELSSRLDEQATSFSEKLQTCDDASSYYGF